MNNRFSSLIDWFKNAWKEGDIQRKARIIYDVTWNIILFFLIAGFLAFLFIGSIGVGYFASLVKDEPIRSYDEMANDIYNYSETSKLYFAGDVYFGDIRSDLRREETTLEQISPTLIDAVLATEDEYFNEHNGVVPKAILRALLQEFSNASTQTGGSTLTQQLIKNQVLTNEVSFDRKAKEILLALRLERFFEKDEILEAYFNVIPYGRDSSGNNIAGIQTAAQGIFGVDASNVTLPQAAYLAGLPQSPFAYTPFHNNGELKDSEQLENGIERMHTVLYRMESFGSISEQQLEDALAYDITADFRPNQPSTVEKYPYLTFELEKRATEIIKDHIMEENGYTEKDLANNQALDEEHTELAERAMRTEGYRIHSTIDKEIYDAFQEVAANYEHYGYDRTFTATNPDTGESYQVTDQIQAGGMLIENNTGRIISFLGGRKDTEETNYFNYATDAKRSIGSTIKPLLDYAPAIEKGIISPGTPLADYKRSFDVPGQSEPWDLGNYGGVYHGLVSAREALAKSYNIPAAEVYLQMIDENPAQYLEKMGITSLTEEDKSILSLSIGAMNEGISVEENTNAFTTLANSGQFVDAFMIDKITTADGDPVYEHKAEAVDVFSPQTAYLTTDMLRDVLEYGTGTYVNSQLKYPSVDWSGKSGTSNDYHDAWFVGSNPNVTFGTWIGYENPYPINHDYPLSYSQRNQNLWAQLMNAASDIRPELVAPSESFERPEGIVEHSYCAVSGKLPSDLCAELGLIKSDLFDADHVPTEVDNSLTRGSQVIVNGRSVVPGPNTPSAFVNGDGISFNKEWLDSRGYTDLQSVEQLYPRTERSKWERIGGIGSSSEGGSVTNDGQAPAPPTSVNTNGSALQWGRSGSSDVVGYYVYRAASSGSGFTHIGSTTSTSYPVGGQPGVYVVRAADYFGEVSGNSNQAVIAAPEPEPEPEPEPQPAPDSETEPEPEQPADEPDNQGNGEQEEAPDEEPASDAGGNGNQGNGNNQGDNNEDTDNQQEETPVNGGSGNEQEPPQDEDQQSGQGTGQDSEPAGDSNSNEESD